jgi:hypothetical protein
MWKIPCCMNKEEVPSQDMSLAHKAIFEENF